MIIVFDLDDTLYPELEFVKSGFWAVACHLAPEDPVSVYRDLWQVFREQGSGRVFDTYAQQQGRAIDIPQLVDVYRFHTPLITLDVESRIVMQSIHRQFATAMITDGPYRMQANKFHALGLEAWIDFPVFTDRLGTSKPDPRPYQVVMERYGSDQRYLYIADNPRKDFIAPRQLGWGTIRLKRVGGVYADLPAEADHEIARLVELLDLLPSAVS